MTSLRDSSPSAEQLAIAAIQLRARQTAFWMIKRRARDYRTRPMQLEILFPGLAVASPAKMIAVGETLLDQERRTPRRYFGFGGETSAVNARAVILLGRYQRRFGARLAEVA